MYFHSCTDQINTKWAASILAHNAYLCVVGIIAGLLASQFYQQSVPPITLIALIVALVMALVAQQKWLFFVSFSFLSIGIGLHLAGYTTDALQRGQRYRHAWVDAIATVVDVEQIEHPRFAQKITVELHKSHKQGSADWISTNDRIVIMNRYSLLAAPGDTLVFSRLMCNTTRNNILMQRKNIVATAYGFKAAQVLSNNNWSLARYMHKKRLALVKNLEKMLTPNTFDLFSSIFLGNKQTLNHHRDLIAHFNQWGLAHYLARAGLHLAFLLMLLALLLRIFMIPTILRPWLALGTCLGYHALSWPSIPFIRALIAGCLYQVCHLAKCEPDALHILHISIITQLYSCPQSIFMLDFQLTYALTYALILLSRTKQKNKVETGIQKS